ncbi:MAG: hypothetical protein CL895_08255 [Dehalococcoidia bacterium]|nr:hypothetical protein [Dehalococcoidia bacterium]
MGLRWLSTNWGRLRLGRLLGSGRFWRLRGQSLLGGGSRHLLAQQLSCGGLLTRFRHLDDSRARVYRLGGHGRRHRFRWWRRSDLHIPAQLLGRVGLWR